MRRCLEFMSTFLQGFIWKALKAKVQAGVTFVKVGLSLRKYHCSWLCCFKPLLVTGWPSRSPLFFFPPAGNSYVISRYNMSPPELTELGVRPFFATLPSPGRICWPRAGFYQKMRKASILFSFQRVHGLVPSSVETSKCLSLRRPLVVTPMCLW